MAMVRFAVVRFGDRWSILQDERRAGAYEEQLDAIEVAQRLAADAQRSGASIELLVQDLCGEVREHPVVVN